MNHKYLITVILFLMALGCQEPTSHHISAVFDGTDGATEHIETTEILSHLKRTWGQNNPLIIDEVTIDLTTIDHTSMQRNENFFLPQAGPWWSRNDVVRRDSQAAYFSRVKKAINQFASERIQRDHSYVLRNLQGPLKRLVESDANVKDLYVFGDMIQNNPHTVSFYRFKETPSELIKLEVYDSLSQILRSDSPLPDLGKIREFKVVYEPPKKYDELYRNTIKFWERYFSEHGLGEIEFVPNL